MAHAKVLCMVQMELCIDSLRQGDLLVVHILVNVENKEDDYYPGITLDMTFNENGLLAKKTSTLAGSEPLCDGHFVE